MRICLIGKYPPIQGGVSMRNFHMAHELAKRGHKVHVLTNARDVELPWRLLMRDEDWGHCEANYGEGSVRVGWTEPMDRRQAYIPRGNPVVSKLVSLALAAHKETPFDLVHSFYLEPYGVAGHMVAQALGLPHVVKTAGSDAGKLWFHPQLEPLYDHVLSSADLFISSGTVAQRAVDRGIDPQRVVASRGFQLATESFCPDGESLALPGVLALADETQAPDFGQLCWGSFRGDRPYIGVYGKLGEGKGSFALLNALSRARSEGADIGLVAMAHGHSDVEKRFRGAIEAHELKDVVLQIPFLPHWRVPEFIRSCRAVCCLEQDFAITIHNPIVTQEVMSCGGCLIASTELLNKHIHTRQLVSGVNCFAIRDVNDVGELSHALLAVAHRPDLATAIGARARRYIERFDTGMAFAAHAEALFERTLKTRPDPPFAPNQPNAKPIRISLTEMALTLMDSELRRVCLAAAESEPETPQWVAEIRCGLQDVRLAGEKNLDVIQTAIEIDYAIRSVSSASVENDQHGCGDHALLFRAGGGCVVDDGELLDRVPSLNPAVKILDFDVAVAPFIAARQPADLPPDVEPVASHLVVVPGAADRHSVLQVDPAMASLLRRFDGTTTVRDLVTVVDGGGDIDDGRIAARLLSLLTEGVVAFRAA